MKPIKLQRMKRTNNWTPTRRVWFQKNDDESFSDWANRKTPYDENESHKLGKERAERATKRLQQGLDPFGED